jgi:hypothetical protein
MLLSPGELALSGDGDFEGFTVYKGHPYCEPCHVRLRLPKCKKCKKSIRDHDRAVEALGGKWCWSCFVCEVSSFPFTSCASCGSILTIVCRGAIGRSMTRLSSRETVTHTVNTVSASYFATRCDSCGFLGALFSLLSLLPSSILLGRLLGFYNGYNCLDSYHLSFLSSFYTLIFSFNSDD